MKLKTQTKLFKWLLPLMLVLMLPQIASAYDFMVDGLCYNYNDDGTSVTLTFGNGYENLSGALNIPLSVTYNGTSYSVTTIGDETFYGCSGLTSVTIPNSVTSIGNLAFAACPSLTSVSFPNSLTSIGYDAFNDCFSLCSATIPNSVTTIGNYTFYSCNKLNSLTLTGHGQWNPMNDLPSISQLKTVNIGSGITSLGNFGFTPNIVNCYAETPSTCFSGTFNTYDCELHVLAASLAAYFMADYWQNFNNMVNDLTDKVTLDKTSANLAQWEAMALSATVSTDGNEVIWSSTNSSVATVDENGVVTATGGGECDIYATLVSNPAVYAICHVYVSYPEITLSLSDEELEMKVGEEKTLIATITPDNTGLTPAWVSSDESIATVEKGVITAINEGECYITATVLDKTAICHITVSYPEITISLSEDSIEMNIGNEKTLTAIITPNNTGLIPSWNSSDENVATVENGVVTAVGDGECDIIASVLNKTATCHVTVGVNVVITLNKENAIIGANQMLTIYPSCTPDLPVEFIVTTSDPSVAVARVVNRFNAPAARLMSFPEKDMALNLLEELGTPSESKDPALASTKAVMIVGVQNGTATITVTTADGQATPAVLNLRVVDVDGDRTITASDITCLYNYLLNGDETYITTSDTDGDGNITSSDITVLYNLMLGN